MGSTGEFEDRREWTVAAYLSKRLAEKHVQKANEWYEWNVVRIYPKYKPIPVELVNPYDPFMSVDYTGTLWGYSTISLRDSLPKEKKNAV